METAPVQGVLSPNDFYNHMMKVAENKDKKINALFDSVIQATESLEYSGPDASKYKIIVSIEYLLVRLRILVEAESVEVKRVLTVPEVPVTLKTAFQKRDQYLAQVSLKLTSLREDIANLQKVVYTANNFLK